MNYITHLNAVFNQMDEDTALTAQDISLYIALFRRWNKNFFKNPIVVVRDELMKMAKIGSANTYSRCLKRLHKLGYINQCRLVKESSKRLDFIAFILKKSSLKSL